MASRKWTVTVTGVAAASLLALSVSAPSTVKAASNMVPDYEVKLLMSPSAVVSAEQGLVPGTGFAEDSADYGPLLIINGAAAPVR